MILSGLISLSNVTQVPMDVSLIGFDICSITEKYSYHTEPDKMQMRYLLFVATWFDVEKHI